MIIRVFFVVCFWILTPILSHAAAHYITPAGAGGNTGADWSNAFAGIPATLTRGDTYYLSEGDYGTYTANEAVSGTSRIIIKKCGTGDGTCEAAAGYSAASHDGQAVFSQITFSTHYWTLDGGSRTDWDSGHGILVYNSDIGIKGITATSIDNLIIQYVEIDNNSTDGCRPGYNDGKEGIYAPTGADNNLIQYCYIHDSVGNLSRMYGSNNTYQYNLFARSANWEGVHGAAIQEYTGLNGTAGQTTNLVIRYNIFEDIGGTAAVNIAGDNDGVDVYGNVFFWTGATYPYSLSSVQSNQTYYTSPATIVDISSSESGEAGLINLRVYNNTFYAAPNGASGGAGFAVYLTSDSTTNHFYNNYFFDCPRVILDQVDADHDYNYFNNSTILTGGLQTNETSVNGSDPTVNAASYNYRFSVKGPAGLALSSPYSSTDPDGRTRGADSDWDIGAYEYVSGVGVATRYAVRAVTNE